MRDLQNKIDSVIPYFRSYTLDENTLYNRVHAIFPESWNLGSLVNERIILHEISNGVAKNVILGIEKNEATTDIPLDILIAEIFAVIQLNQREEKKRQLMEQKIVELQQYIEGASLEEVQNLSIAKTITTVIPTPVEVPDVSPETVVTKVKGDEMMGKIRANNFVVPLSERDTDEDSDENTIDFTPSIIEEMKQNIK